MLCKTCPSKSLCSSLCPEAEAYVSQDKAKQREFNVPVPQYGRWPKIRKPRKGLSVTQKKIMHLIVDGKTSKQISEIIGISESDVRVNIMRITRKLVTS